VPTKTQWVGVLDNNTQSTVGTWDEDHTNYSSAWFFGDDLMLPAAVSRSYLSGALYSRGVSGLYWSSSEYSSSNAWLLYFTSGYASTYYINRLRGSSVRCISE